MENKPDRLDAGLASLDHYKVRLPPWRHRIRQSLLPIVRWETPYVALLQDTMRSPMLDSYFAMSANLGTHTAFMVVLPILFWCGYMSMGRAMVHVLAAGVFWSGFVKDLLCLPRPLSPPLQRITMSGSAALEYGFPSTHSTNAVSVVYCALYILKQEDPDISARTNVILQVALYTYAGSIILGRLYCGMHGFFDVILGSSLGAAIGAVQCHYGSTLDHWLYSSPFRNVMWLTLIILILVRIHPEPADDCPCFDDSVAFAGVVLGCEFASWHLAQQQYFRGPNGYAEIPFSLEKTGWFIAILRIILGIAAVLIWRSTMKSLLLRFLPPLFRRIEKVGLDLPRKFFMPASQYKSVPAQHKDDNVIPNARDIPRLLSNLNRRRAVSVGPQSHADAIETLAYREKRRRDSLTMSTPKPQIKEKLGEGSYFLEPGTAAQASGSHTRKRSSSLDQFRAQMGSVNSSALGPTVDTPLPEGETKPFDQNEQDRLDEKALFDGLQKLRVRYDVEVVTKLIVYSGIGWISIELSPVMFYKIGLY